MTTPKFQSSEGRVNQEHLSSAQAAGPPGPETPPTKFLGDRRYAVLVDVGTDWPEVVFVGRNFELAGELAGELRKRGIAVSIQATVTPEEILEEAVA